MHICKNILMEWWREKVCYYRTVINREADFKKQNTAHFIFPILNHSL